MFSRYSFLFFLFFLFYSCERLTDLDDKDLQIPPGVPKGLQVYAAYDGAIDLVWNENVEPSFSRYRIYRSIDDSLSFTFHDSTSRIYYYDDSLDYHKKYFYYLTAVNAAGIESNPGNIVSAIPVNLYPPAVPRFLQVHGRNWEGYKHATLRWQRNFESDVAGYQIFRSGEEEFQADSVTYIGFSVQNTFIDEDDSLSFMKDYYYKIRSIDNGGLVSNPGNVNYDIIHTIPEIIFPLDNSETGYFQNFLFISLNKPARYKIVLQTNQFFGEIWNKEINTTQVDDTLSIGFDPFNITPNQYYYWRIITYSKQGNEANAISPLYKFYLKQ